MDRPKASHSGGDKRPQTDDRQIVINERGEDQPKNESSARKMGDPPDRLRSSKAASSPRRAR
jgi:hypothetical protein